MEYQPTSNEKYDPFLFQVFKVLLFKIRHQIFYFLLFYITAFTSANIFFLTDSLNPPLHPLNNQNLLSVTKAFFQCSLIMFICIWLYLFGYECLFKYKWLAMLTLQLHSFSAITRKLNSYKRSHTKCICQC